ncbi:hypothetical protein Hanom_Chr04g00292261 [Helianthus anomalus]
MKNKSAPNKAKLYKNQQPIRTLSRVTKKKLYNRSNLPRAANEPNVRRTVREPFDGKFVCVCLFIKANEHEQEIPFV